MYVFISHSSQNSVTAEEICELIESSGHQCFLAPRDIRSGHEYAEEIINGIDRSGVMVLILSKDSNESPHVLREIERAVSKRVPIIVYKLEDVQLSKSMEYFLMSHQWVSKKSNIEYSAVVKCVNDLANGTLKITLSAPPAAKPAPKPEPVLEPAPERVPISAAPAPTPAPVQTPAQTPVQTPAAASAPTPAPVQAPVAAPVTAAQPQKKKPMLNTIGIIAVVFGLIFVIGLGFSALVTMVESMTEAFNKTGGFEIQTNNGENSISVSFGDDDNDSSDQSKAIMDDGLADALLGETIVFGTYNGEPIEWRFIHVSEDNTKAVVIADKVLTMKCYDAAESGTYGSYDGKEYGGVIGELDRDIQRLTRGDNSWELSNLRTWLNSTRENVAYADQEPIRNAMCEKTNPYNIEAGFLHDFTDKELAAIVPTKITTNGVETEDLVYLLSSEELSWLVEADVSKYAIPTQQAIDKDESNWYEFNKSGYNTEDHYWWLRDNDGTTACNVNVVSFSYVGGVIEGQPAGHEGYGVRPVMTLDISEDSTVVLEYLAQEFLNEITQP